MGLSFTLILLEILNIISYDNYYITDIYTDASYRLAS